MSTSHEQRMALAKSKFEARVILVAVKPLEDITEAEFVAAVPYEGSYEEKAAWRKLRQRFVAADVMRKNVADLTTRVEAWLAAGSPGNQMFDLGGIIGLAEKP